MEDFERHKRRRGANARGRTRASIYILPLLVILAAPAWAQDTVQVLHRHVVPIVSQGKVAASGALPATQRLAFTLHLPVRNPTALSALIQRQSDARSADYRHWLTVSEFTSQFGRSNDEYQRVIRFASDQGFAIVHQSPNRLLLSLQGTVDQIEKAFAIKLKTFAHPTEHRTFFSPDREPSVALDVPVSHISGLNNYSPPQPVRKHRPASIIQFPVPTGSGPGGSWLGPDIRAAYDMGPNTGSGQTVALLEFSGYTASDITTFLTNTNQPNTVPIVNIPVEGGTPNSWTDEGDESECAMDIEWILAVAPGLKQLLVYVGPEGSTTGDVLQADGPMLSQLATDNFAKVISSSWIWWPDDPATDEPYFQEMAVQGQTYLQASGDYGAYEGDDGYDESYPGEDPYVTAVGGTTLTTTGPGGIWQSEVVWNDGQAGAQPDLEYGSGGGIANDGAQTFPIPTWQAAVINSANGGSLSTRNAPDVAMEADVDSYECIVGICDTYGNGTSIATPRWAAYLALVNQQLVANNGSPGLGLLTPALYAIGQGPNYAAAFHDIVVGDDAVFAGQTPIYDAVAGYDLTTGWGSMDGQGLTAALLGPATPSSFVLSTSLSGVTIAQGTTGSATILIWAIGGFKDAVSLSVSGLPPGVTATFSSNPASGTSVFTLNADPTAALVDTTLTITGTSKGITASVPLTLSIVSPAGFTLSVAPGSETLIQGAGAYRENITITRSPGFTAPIVLTVTGLPIGVSAVVDYNILYITADHTAAIGSFTATLNGSTQGATQPTSSTPLLLTVVSFPTLNISLSKTELILHGASVSDTLTATTSAGSTSVYFQISGLPTGVSASIVPNAVDVSTGSGSALLTLYSAINNGTKNGSGTVTVTGTAQVNSSQVSGNANIKLVVAEPTFDLVPAPYSVVVRRGSSASTQIEIKPLGAFSGAVLLSATGFPPGIAVTFSPNPATGASTLTFTAGPSAALGSSNVTITGTSGLQAAATVVKLSVGRKTQE